ncbi:Uncharacterized membrane protein YkoI [Nonomuraea maritima]|uniref:Uncharacterized membrane protein YkoI n=1 Tax=Nonomuraea maritima TaxID=683260 RepID=A0A1G9HHZ6_9ACTN|nr:PepSY domain-containing protein [Nonomuraea maritima]SDL12641.1 Uncharacterized membrane protein YkoI [Nonomuraea maritima]
MNKTIAGSLVGVTMLAGGCATVQGQADRAVHLASPSLGAAAGPTAGPTEGPTGGAPGGPASQGSPPVSPNRVGVGDLKQAAEAALRAVPGATVMTLEAEEDGRRWEVQLVGQDGTEHQVDVESGKVVGGPVAESQDQDDKNDDRDLVRAAKLDYAQAADRVMTVVPEGRITELSLDLERGKAVWESDVITPNGAKHEVTIDATSGEVLRTNRTTT